MTVSEDPDAEGKLCTSRGLLSVAAKLFTEAEDIERRYVSIDE